MHRRPSAAATPHAVLPLPPRQRDLASLKSPDSVPHTPTKRADPLPLFSTNTNRYSTDSWNSSNCDGADDMVFEWKPEQIILLTRTLDALPSHLLTPFNGPVPPSNLLDKLARGVAKAKNPVDWPHSIHATRVKIVELARIRAKEARDESSSDTIIEEESDSSDVPLQQTTNIGLKRTLHRQSSMDFMQPPKLDLKNNANLSRLSRRLQRTERMLLSPTYEQTSPSLNPSTPSSTTLNSQLSDARPSRMLRRSISSLSNGSDQFMAPTAVPSVRRLRRSDTFAGSTLFPTGLKRAPSFGGSSRNSLESVAMSIDFNARDSDTSDEEEKLRGKKAKRARRKASSPTPTPPPLSPSILMSPSPKPTIRPKKSQKTPTNATSSTPVGKDDKAENKRSQRKKSRQPSIIGPVLPKPQETPQSPAPVRVSRISQTPAHDNRSPVSSAVYTIPVPSSPYNLTHIPSVSPQVSRTLRRSRPVAPLPRTSLARKISFSNLAMPVDESTGSGAGLGSAFQLH